MLSITKNCETPIKQTPRKAEETLEFRMIKTRETFHFNPPLSIEGSCKIVLITLEVYNSNMNITTDNNRFELYTFIFDVFSFEDLNGELEDIVSFSKISNEQLQDEEIAPSIISA